MAPVLGRPRRTLPLALLLALAVVAAACSHDAGSQATSRTTRDEDQTQGGPTTSTALGHGSPATPSPLPDSITIQVLSSQPDRVTGDDARIRVIPASGSSGSLRLTRNGTDVTSSLASHDGVLEGVVHGFFEGENDLTATDGTHRSTQRITAWPLTGPMISGPRLPLLACSTEAFGLGAPTDANCSAPTTVSWHYLTTDHQLEDLPGPPSGKAPADIGRARIGGKVVPLYVRDEKGVVDRSLYEIATVDGAWNRRILYRFGGDCGTTFGQGSLGASPLDPTELARGYAVATSSWNDFSVQCNDVLSAEATMMVKEKVIEELGAPAFTIGEGAGGGAAQLHLLVQDYPGLVDGVVAEQPFPDVVSMTSGITDCGLLAHYYAGRGSTLTAAQRTAIDGFATAATCGSWHRSFGGLVDPTDGCDPKIPASAVYDATTNRGGVRCTLQDANANQFGVESGTRFAKRPLDNVGVQYGLVALNTRRITVDQFLDLNAAIGGYDLDGRFQANREEADATTVETAYEQGRIVEGGGDLLTVPIIDIDTFDDATGDVHDRLRAFSLRDRLSPGGDLARAPGFQIWTRDATTGPAAGPAAVAVVDRWLTAMHADTSGASIGEILARDRPAAAVDNCLAKGAATPTSGAGVYAQGGACATAYPVSGDPRIAAGAPERDDILKCQLQPADPATYDVAFTPAQAQRLEQVFPNGVCDYSQAGQGQTLPAMTDQSYADVHTPAEDA